MSGPIDRGAPGVGLLLRVGVVAAFVSAVVGMVGDSTVNHVAAACAVGVVIAVPLLRVVMLAGHWARVGDRRYAATAAALVAVAVCGALIALI